MTLSKLFCRRKLIVCCFFFSPHLFSSGTITTGVLTKQPYNDGSIKVAATNRSIRYTIQLEAQGQKEKKNLYTWRKKKKKKKGETVNKRTQTNKLDFLFRAAVMLVF